MTLRIDVEDGSDRWSEMLAEVEAGRDVVIARGEVPLATVKAAPPPPDRDKVEAAIARIMEIRRTIPPTTVEEIIEWRNEGRR